MGTRLKRRRPTRLEKIAETKRLKKITKKLINKKEDDDGGSNTGHTKRT